MVNEDYHEIYILFSRHYKIQYKNRAPAAPATPCTFFSKQNVLSSGIC
jgi:hypothetical protein